MHVEYSQLPPPEDSADRIFICDNAVIVLDGATAFVPVPVSAQTYAGHLGQCLVDQLSAEPEIDLRDALSSAICKSATNLELPRGASPSSTVAILRKRPQEYDVLVLGDTAVFWGHGDKEWQLSDDRLSRIAPRQREAYRVRLRAHHGFDENHKDSLRALQTEQRRHRNIEGGYWIAETDPRAAHKAYVTTISHERLEWAVIATDGAYKPLKHQGSNSWNQIAGLNTTQLATLISDLQTWERESDPNGQIYPRAKRHDDKLIAAVRVRSRPGR